MKCIFAPDCKSVQRVPTKGKEYFFSWGARKSSWGRTMKMNCCSLSWWAATAKHDWNEMKISFNKNMFQIILKDSEKQTQSRKTQLSKQFCGLEHAAAAAAHGKRNEDRLNKIGAKSRQTFQNQLQVQEIQWMSAEISIWQIVNPKPNKNQNQPTQLRLYFVSSIRPPLTIDQLAQSILLLSEKLFSNLDRSQLWTMQFEKKEIQAKYSSKVDGRIQQRKIYLGLPAVFVFVFQYPTVARLERRRQKRERIAWGIVWW